MWWSGPFPLTQTLLIKTKQTSLLTTLGCKDKHTHPGQSLFTLLSLNK